MNILLGIYETPTFKRVLNSSHSTFPFSEIIPDWDKIDDWGIIPIVQKACQKCDIIYFVLDGITFPLQPLKSVTCEELLHILRNKSVFNKTIFILGGEELTNDEFQQWYKSNDI